MTELLDPKQKEKWKKDKELIQKLWDELEEYQKYQFVSPIMKTSVELEDEGFIAFVGDIHLGHSSLNISKMKKDHELMRKYNMYIIGMGDYIENYNAKATQQKISTGMRLRHQKDLAKKYFLPLKERIIGLLMGNHEHRSVQTDDFQPVGWLAEELEVNDLWWMNTLYCKTPSREKPIVIHVAHMKSGTSWHSKVYPNAKARRDFPHEIGIADVTVIAHNHDPSCAGDENKDDIRSGTYVQFDDYSQKLGFFPSRKNYLPVLWYDAEDIITFKDISHAVKWYESPKKRKR